MYFTHKENNIHNIVPVWMFQHLLQRKYILHTMKNNIRNVLRVLVFQQLYCTIALICHIAKVNSTSCLIQSWPSRVLRLVTDKTQRLRDQRLAERKFGSAHRQNEK